MGERIRILSLEGNKLHEDVRGSGQQSRRIDYGSKALLVREVTPEFTGVDNATEITRRKKSIDLHKRILPEYTQDCELVVLQGSEENTRKPITLLGRMVPRGNNVVPITDLPLREQLTNQRIARGVAEINRGYIEMILKYGVIPDVGANTQRKTGLPKVIDRFVRVLSKNNVLINYSGEKVQVFCDPDWYLKSSTLNEKFIRAKFRILCGCVARYVLFKVTSEVGKLS